MSSNVELQALYEAKGELTPANVLAAATPTTSPLHHYFEWDDTTAGAQYRLVQAGLLIRRCKVSVFVKPEEVRTVRQFVCLPSSEGERSYVPTVEALADSRRDLVLDQAVKELTAVRNKYAALVDIDKAWRLASRAAMRSQRCA